MQCVGMIQQVTGIFFTLVFILSGIQTGILSLTFDLAFHLTFYLACFLASWSHILNWHSFCDCSRRKKSGEAHSDLQAQKARRGPQRFSSRKGPAGPTETVALQKSGETHGDQELAGAVQRGGRWSPASLTAITSWQVMSGEEEEEGRKEGGCHDIQKSNDPHLAGGDIYISWRDMHWEKWFDHPKTKHPPWTNVSWGIPGLHLFGAIEGVLNFWGNGIIISSQCFASHLLRCMLQKVAALFNPNRFHQIRHRMSAQGLRAGSWKFPVETELAHSDKRPWDTQVCIERPSPATSEGSSQLQDWCLLTPFPCPNGVPVYSNEAGLDIVDIAGGFLNQNHLSQIFAWDPPW